MTLNIGDKAPNFSLESDNAGLVNLADLAGKKVVLYFYPKDDTPGCTTEALDFTSLKSEFEAKNTVVLGLSKDKIAKHCKFREKHNLGITLLSDEDCVVCESYGTWVEKSMYGRTYMGIQRDTFLIDEQGVIQQIWRKVKVTNHAKQVLEAI